MKTEQQIKECIEKLRGINQEVSAHPDLKDEAKELNSLRDAGISTLEWVLL